MMPCLHRLGRRGLPGHCRASVAGRGVLEARFPPISGLRVSEGPEPWALPVISVGAAPVATARPIAWWRQKDDRSVVMHTFISGLGPRIHVQLPSRPPANHLLPCLIYSHFLSSLGFPGGSMVKNPPAKAKDTGLVPDPGRSFAVQPGNSPQ